jgi:hypothetical protein
MALGVRLSGGTGLTLALAALAALAGCDQMTHTRLDFSTTEKVAVTEIRISGGSGNVTVRGDGPAGQVRIDRVVRYRGAEPARTYRFDGTVLHVETRCGRNCSVTYDIQAPPTVAVRGGNGSGNVDVSDVAAVDVEIGSGNITVADATGDVAVRTRSGNIAVGRVAGNLTASATSGTVEATEIRGGTARVDVRSGDVTLELTGPADVSASATSGNISLSVPDGRYRVDADADSGRTQIDVANDPGAPHALRLRTSSGNITVATG